jgi:hypothetical protein
MNRRLLTPFRLLLLLLVAGFCAVIWWPEVLKMMGFPFHREWFLDSRAILAANDAARLGADPTQPNTLDPFNRPHVYSDWWLGLRWLGLTRADNFAFGGTCCLAFLTVALAGVRPASYAAAAGLAAVFLAPPTLLALQRANNDLVVFAMLGTGLLALRSGSSASRLACFGALVILATGLKYYPIVAAGALLAVLPWRRTTGWSFGLTTAGALFVLWSERASIGRGMFELPRTIHVFGAQLIWREVAPDRPAVAASAVVLLVLGAVLAWRRGWTSGLAGAARGPEGERLMFAVGACVLVGCFLAGTSYAYRWIFGLWLWPWLWREAVAGRTAARLALGCWLVNLWADGSLGLVLNSFNLSYRPELGWRLLVQPLCWILMVLLAGWLLEAVVAQARAWREQRHSA